MKKIQHILIAITLLILALPQAATASILGEAGSYNAFIFNDFTSSNTDVEGRLAVGGDADLTSYGVGNKATGTGAVLAVGGDLTATNGQAYGDVQVGGTINTTSFTVLGTLENTSPSVDFDTEEAYLKTLSATLAWLDANGLTVYQYGGVYLQGVSSDVVVFSVDGGSLSSSWGIDLSGVDSGTTIIINVSGTDLGLAYMGMSSLQAYSDNILFNFFEAESLSLTGVTVYGSVLAPYADVTGAGGSIYGTLVASSFASSIEMEYNMFTGDVPGEPVPEPATLALMGLGFIGIAAYLRRK